MEQRVYKRKLADAFRVDELKRKNAPRVYMKARALYFLYATLLHAKHGWLKRENVYTIIVQNNKCKSSLKLFNYTWGEWMRQLEEAGLVKVLEIERGFTRLKFPLIEAIIESHELSKVSNEK